MNFLSLVLWVRVPGRLKVVWEQSAFSLLLGGKLYSLGVGEGSFLSGEPESDCAAPSDRSLLLHRCA